MIKKGQLRRWKNDRPDGDVFFMTIGYKIIRDGTDRHAEVGWERAHQGRKVWSILEDGVLYEMGHIEIESCSEVIE